MCCFFVFVCFTNNKGGDEEEDDDADIKVVWCNMPSSSSGHTEVRASSFTTI